MNLSNLSYLEVLENWLGCDCEYPRAHCLLLRICMPPATTVCHTHAARTRAVHVHCCDARTLALSSYITHVPTYILSTRPHTPHALVCHLCLRCMLPHLSIASFVPVCAPSLYMCAPSLVH